MKQFIFMLLTALSFSSFAQRHWSVHDILGEKIDLDYNKTYLAICCDSRNCHNCVIDLGRYCSELSKENQSVEAIFVIKGGGIGEMRITMTAIKEYVPEGIPIYFDLTANRKEALFKKEYSYMPILIVLKPNGRRHYFLYKDLFYNVQKGEPIDSKASKKIQNLLTD